MTDDLGKRIRALRDKSNTHLRQTENDPKEIEELEKKFNEEYYGGPIIKVGKTCFSCKHRVSRKGNFVTCKHNNHGQPIWEKARCKKWRLTNNKKALVKFSRFIDGWSNLSFPPLRYFYRKTNDVKVTDSVPITLGRCCFLCEFRSEKKRSKVVCDKRKGRLVWEKCCCRWFKLTSSIKRLDQYKKYMKKSGIDTTNNYKWVRSR